MRVWPRRLVWSVVVLVALIGLRGHIGFWLQKTDYDGIAQAALELNLQSGQKGTYEYANDKLKSAANGRIRVMPTIDRGVVLRIDQGGGQRSIEGMVHASDGVLKTVIESGILHTGSIGFTRLSRKWWLYTSQAD